jgi:hypothetical protein
MNQTTHSPTEPVVHGMTLSRAALTQSGPIASPRSPKEVLPPAPMLAIRVPPAMLQAARRSGVVTTTAVLFDQSAAVVLLWLHAGRYVSVLLADLGNAEMQSYMAEAVADNVLRIALLTDRENAVTATALPGPLRKVLVEPAQRTPAQLSVLAWAMSYAMRLLGDDKFLQSLHIDARRLKGKSLHLYLGSDASAGCDGKDRLALVH